MPSYRETRLELLSGPEIAAYMAELNLLYIPVAPLEWHGPHLPYGTDTLNAYAVCLEASRRFGGLVHPAVYAGTEIARRPEIVRAFGLPVETPVVGMDMPGFAIKSFYMTPGQFKSCIQTVVATAAAVGFTKIVVINGHGADEQKLILEELAVA
jgi:creatinine amidohydrolase